MKSINIGLLVGIAAAAMVGLALLATAGGIGGASVYTTFTDAKTTGEDVHVVGSWVMREKSHYDANLDIFQFYMQDTTQQIALVKFHDPKPVNFETAERVVVQGKYEGDFFTADRIFMKCPSKYNDGESVLEEASAKM
ncbi:MAG: cytochrome c maturation protein CcmE [Bacteroidota bacterium]